MDRSASGPSVPGILQARLLEWVAMASSGGSSLVPFIKKTVLSSLHSNVTLVISQVPERLNNDKVMASFVCVLPDSLFCPINLFVLELISYWFNNCIFVVCLGVWKYKFSSFVFKTILAILGL